MKKKKLFKAVLIAFTLVVSSSLFAQTKNIVETAMTSQDHTTLVAAVKAADLVGVLSSDGPFTVFAPTNEAFANLPEGTLDSLLKPENKATLQAILKYHVVAGKFMAADVIDLINKNDGKATIKTVNGESLIAWMKDGAVYIKDAKGNSAKVTTANLDTTNGVIHVINSVLLPM
ncbi:fasciclin domain-containing protein [Yeosuana marina]|uniref:fasciclin domain-containing protein n=1 Tax=Yeosuana marina TaxID=1565536 RepID=UPI0030EE680E|tara:strand:- start:309 stop:830 length:522 start_codon:yes stop_codon:yes gene_type:complete